VGGRGARCKERGSKKNLVGEEALLDDDGTGEDEDDRVTDPADDGPDGVEHVPRVLGVNSGVAVPGHPNACSTRTNVTSTFDPMTAFPPE